MKSIFIFFLLLGTSPLSAATEQIKYFNYDSSKFRFSQESSGPLTNFSTLTLTQKTTTSSAEHNQKTENLETGIDNDCNAIAYQVTLFTPCGAEDAKQLWARTKIIFIFSFGSALVVAANEEYSNRNNPYYSTPNIFKKWYGNVKQGAVWDKDQWYINYIGHPYFGSVYYQNARKSGYNQWNSFVYSALMSTVFWEFGLEAISEPPSVQDLFVTPIMGWVVGEWAYNTEKAIIANDGYAFGSKIWGSIARAFIDPVGTIGGWFGAKHVEVGSFNITRQPAYYGTENNDWQAKLAVTF
ncbi:MAG: DUF3943 domain-containing protein [Thiohalomonadales bacterium]